MHAVSLKKFLQDPQMFLTTAEVEPILVVRDDAQNLICMSEAQWRTLQETLYLLQSPQNAERLQTGIQQALENYVPTPNQASPTQWKFC